MQDAPSMRTERQTDSSMIRLASFPRHRRVLRVVDVVRLTMRHRRFSQWPTISRSIRYVYTTLSSSQVRLSLFRFSRFVLCVCACRVSQRSINEGTEEKRKRKKRDGAGGAPRNESEKERKGSEMLSYYFGIPGDEGEGMEVKEGYFASIWFLLLFSDIHTSVYSLIVCYSFIRIYAEPLILSLSLSRSHIALFLVHSHTRENATV